MPLQVVISDTSCLIDLRKSSLLDAFLRIPYELLIPNTLFEDELLRFTVAQKKALIRGGLKVVDLPGKSVLLARHIAMHTPHLSVHDEFAYALARLHPGSILLTGDGRLRALARRGSERRRQLCRMHLKRLVALNSQAAQTRLQFVRVSRTTGILRVVFCSYCTNCLKSDACLR